MTITTKYDLGQALILDSQPCIISEIHVKQDNSIEYRILWKNPFAVTATYMSEKDLDTCIALNATYLENKELYDNNLNAIKDMINKVLKGNRP